MYRLNKQTRTGARVRGPMVPGGAIVRTGAMARGGGILVMLLHAAALAATAQEPHHPGPAERERLAELIFGQLRTPPALLPDGRTFALTLGTSDSTIIHVADPRAPLPRPLFDVARTRAAFAAVLGAEPPGRALPFREVRFVGGGADRVEVSVGEGSFYLDLRDYAVQPVPAESLAVAEARRPRAVRPGLFTWLPDQLELPSPDGRWLAAIREGDLWVRAAAGGPPQRVTDDGSAQHAWDLEGAKWSPDGRLLALRRIDARGVPAIPLVRWLTDGTPVERHPYSHVGEALPQHEIWVIEPGTGRRVRVPPGAGGEPYIHAAAWDQRGGELYVMHTSRLMDRITLAAVDARTGAARTVLVDSADVAVGGLQHLHGYANQLDASKPLLLLNDGERFIWTSQRDGRRHLYLHNRSGRLLRRLTGGEWDVLAVAAIDERRGWLYLVAGGTGERPYDQRFLRVPLEHDAPPQLLADGPVIVSPEFDFGGTGYWAPVFDATLDHFVIARDGLTDPATLELRRADGTLIHTLWRAPTQLLERIGWVPPEEFVARAADGVTEIHGVIVKPPGFDPARSYPVLEDIYAGPFTAYVPRTLGSVWHRFGMAAPGFVVVVTDARGTPGRGRDFAHAGHGAIGAHEVADHAAALRQAAASRPYMDLSRVGVLGWSWGAYFAVRAMLQEPELYRVGVAIAGPADLERFRVSIEPYMGCLPADCTDAYAAASNTQLAGRLVGRLLLVHGTSDDDVPVAETLRLAAALARAGRPFDMLLLPEDDHHLSQNFEYGIGRVLGFLAEHLGAAAERVTRAEWRPQ